MWAGSFAGTVVAWDVGSNKIAHSFKEHLAAVSVVSPHDNNLIATGSVDTKVKLWDLRKKNSVMTIKNHSKPISCIKIAPSL